MLTSSLVVHSLNVGGFHLIIDHKLFTAKVRHLVRHKNFGGFRLWTRTGILEEKFQSRYSGISRFTRGGLNRSFCHNVKFSSSGKICLLFHPSLKKKSFYERLLIWADMGSDLLLERLVFQNNAQLLCQGNDREFYLWRKAVWFG
jgi:hypothetical protein